MSLIRITFISNNTNIRLSETKIYRVSYFCEDCFIDDVAYMQAFPRIQGNFQLDNKTLVVATRKVLKIWRFHAVKMVPVAHHESQNKVKRG